MQEDETRALKNDIAHLLEQQNVRDAEIVGLRKEVNAAYNRGFQDAATVGIELVENERETRARVCDAHASWFARQQKDQASSAATLLAYEIRRGGELPSWALTELLRVRLNGLHRPIPVPTPERRATEIAHLEEKYAINAAVSKMQASKEQTGLSAADLECVTTDIESMNRALREIMTLVEHDSPAYLVAAGAFIPPVEPRVTSEDWRKLGDMAADAATLAERAAARRERFGLADLAHSVATSEVCGRCGAPYVATGYCSRRDEGCQGGRGEAMLPHPEVPRPEGEEDENWGRVRCSMYEAGHKQGLLDAAKELLAKLKPPFYVDGLYEAGQRDALKWAAEHLEALVGKVTT